MCEGEVRATYINFLQLCISNFAEGGLNVHLANGPFDRYGITLPLSSAIIGKRLPAVQGVEKV